MKLSKRLAAALMAMCMLLVSVPAFAATLSQPNNEMTLPTDGSSVDLIFNSTGNQNQCLGIVIKAPSAVALGIDPANLTGTGFATAGTAYEGLLLSGSFAINRTHYTTDITQSEAAKIMYYGEVTHFDFANLEVERIRRTSSNLVVLEAKPQSYMKAIVSGTVKKVNPEALKRQASEDGIIYLEDADFVTLTEAEEAALNGTANRVTDGSAHYDFTASGGAGYNITNLKVKAGQNYSTTILVDTGIFPEGTVFFSANAMGNTNSTTAGLKFTGNSSTGYYMSGEFVASASETYTVYGLRSYYNGSNASRGAAVNINGVPYEFNGIKTNNESWMSASVKWAWDPAPITFTINEGDYFAIEQYKFADYDRLAAIAFVPTSKVAGMDTEDAAWWRTTANIPSQTTLDCAYKITTIPYVKPETKTVTVTVNETSVETNNEAAEVVVANIALTDHRAKPIEAVTLLDALVSAGKITESNAYTYEDTMYVTVDGVNGYDYDKWLLNGGEEIIVTDIEKFDVTNFKPVKLETVLNSIGVGADNYIKVVFNQTNLSKSAISFCYDADKVLTDGESYTHRFLDNMEGAVVSGYGILTAGITNVLADDGEFVSLPAGSKAYYVNDTLGALQIPENTTHSWGYGVSNIRFWSNDAKENKPGALKMADGTYAQHPYRITQNNSKLDNTYGPVDYDYSGTYVLNSNTTGKLRPYFNTYDDKWVLYVDGAKFVYIVKYTVDGEGNISSVSGIESAFTTLKEPYAFSLKDNEKAYVWGYEPYSGEATGGTTMVPLTSTLANPAE